MKKKINVWMILSSVLSLILLAAEGLFLYQVWVLNALPAKFFVPVVILLVLAAVVLIPMMVPWKRWQRRTGSIVLRVIAFVLALLVIIGCSVGATVVARINQTLNTVTNAPTVSAQVGVYVLTDDPAQTIEDAKGYSFGITSSYDAANTEKLLEELGALYGAAPETHDYDTIPAMITGLFLGDSRAIVLNAAYLPLLEEAEGFTDFSSRARLLKEFTIVTEVETTEPEQTQSPDPQAPSDPTAPVPTVEVVDPLYQPFAIYLSGSDTRTTFLAPARNDVNIIAVVNPMTKQILLVNTPRDYFIPNAESSMGSRDKLAHCGVWGIDCSKDTLSNYYGIPLKYYAQINFTGFETLIDAIGGVTIYSEEGDGVLLQPGANYMNGEQALWFARNRNSYPDGDNARGRHQMMVISAVVEQLSGSSIIKNYAQILKSLEGMFITNMPNDTLTSYIKMQLSDMAHWDVFSYAVTGYGGYDQPYSMGGLFAWVMYPDQDTADHAADLMGRMLRGETLTAADIPMP